MLDVDSRSNNSVDILDLFEICLKLFTIYGVMIIFISTSEEKFFVTLLDLALVF